MIYTDLVIVFLGISMVLYVLFGVADFGAGIVELFAGKKAETVITKAIGPVWEANHMWLILVVVILFNGFPKVYAVFSTALHIPIMIFLFGVIGRGSAFVFRHYDVEKNKSEKYYSAIFRFSSLLAVFFLGVLFAAMFSGTIPNEITSFYAYFIAPWANAFCISIGVFVVILSAYLATIYLFAEVHTENEFFLLTRFAKRLLLASIVSGGIIFATSVSKGSSFFNDFFNHTPSVISFVLATLLIPFVLYNIQKRNVRWLRIASVIQLVLILFGWFFLHWPNIIIFTEGTVLSIYDGAAPQATLKVLFWALFLGSFLIFPALYYLFKVFKFKE